jgi:hypothetical protein
MMVEASVRTTKSSWVFCHTRLENSGAKGANKTVPSWMVGYA